MPAIKGIVLAIANVIVIAIGMSVAERDAGTFFLVVMFSGLPAVVIGALLGLFAGVFATRSPYWRAALLTFAAFGLVAVLASIFGYDAAVPIACIPTFVAAFLLERWTRRVVPVPVPVPVATVRSLR